jgi:hypothetical protein
MYGIKYITITVTVIEAFYSFSSASDAKYEGYASYIRSAEATIENSYTPLSIGMLPLLPLLPHKKQC